MFSTAQLVTYAQWAGYFTIFCAVVTVVGWFLRWGIRFRLVGVTGFMTVLTVGLFALSLGLYNRPAVPDALRYVRVFDTGGANVVISISPPVTEHQLQATLQQAAADLYSPGRLSQGRDKMTIRVRTVLHLEPGVSKPLYLGQAKRSLLRREDDQPELEIYTDWLAELSKSIA